MDIKDILDRIRLIADEMLATAESADSVCEDDGCRVLLGVLRDSAYNILRHVEREQLAHRVSGKRTSGRV